MEINKKNFIRSAPPGVEPGSLTQSTNSRLHWATTTYTKCMQKQQVIPENVIPQSPTRTQTGFEDAYFSSPELHQIWSD